MAWHPQQPVVVRGAGARTAGSRPAMLVDQHSRNCHRGRTTPGRLPTVAAGKRPGFGHEARGSGPWERDQRPPPPPARWSRRARANPQGLRRSGVCTWIPYLSSCLLADRMQRCNGARPHDESDGSCTAPAAAGTPVRRQGFWPWRPADRQHRRARPKEGRSVFPALPETRGRFEEKFLCGSFDCASAFGRFEVLSAMVQSGPRAVLPWPPAARKVKNHTFVRVASGRTTG
jgi:hypothetical protein